MRIIKLGLISIIVFYLIIWAFTLLIPNVTIMSRATNISGPKERLNRLLQTNQLSYHDWLINNSEVDVRTSNTRFYETVLFNGESEVNADTIFFELRKDQQAFLRGGIGLYQLAEDSTTTQLFYVFNTRWYKPWEKMAQVMNEAKYGGHMDSALVRLKFEAEKIIE